MHLRDLPTPCRLFAHPFAHRSFPKISSRFRNHLKGKNVSIKHLNQRQLADRWDLSEATLERWRSEGIGPIFLKLQGQVRYRIEDIEAFEADSLRKSTSEREVVGGAA